MQTETHRLPTFVVAVLLAAGCGSKDEPIDPTPVPPQDLSVVIGAGILGTPAAGRVSYPQGTSVNYSFSLASGYDSLLVSVDGVRTSPAGLLSMDRSHVLIAGAVPVVSPAPQDSLGRSLGRVATESNPVPSFQAALGQIVAIADQGGSATLMARAATLDVTPTTAAEVSALVRVNTSLAGKYFSVLDGPDVNADLAPPVQPAPGVVTPVDTVTPTTLVFVNGIWNTYEDALRSFSDLLVIARNTGLLSGGGTTRTMGLSLLYNTSTGGILTDVAGSFNVPCYLSILNSAFSFGRAPTQLSGFPQLCAGQTDLQESLGQYLNVVLNNAQGRIAAPSADLMARLDTLLRVKKQNVIVVAHSQGTMIVREALSRLQANPTEEVGCIGSINVASPIGDAGWPNLQTPVAGRIVKGAFSQDILYLIPPGSKFPTISTNLSDNWDLAIAALNLVGATGAASFATLGAGAHIHSFHSYTQSPATAGWLGDAMRQEYVELANACAGRLTGIARDASTGIPVAGASVTLQLAGQNVWSGTSGLDGAFTTGLQRPRLYDLRITASGYEGVVLERQRVLPRATRIVEAVRLVRTSAAPGAMNGVVRDARNLLPLGGALVELRVGQNATTGSPLATTTTNSAGTFRFANLSNGTYTLVVTRIGYLRVIQAAIVIGGTETGGQDVVLYPINAGSDVGIVLTWGVIPSDLDSHLTGPNNLGGRFHVFYADRGALNSEPFGGLDVDDVSSFGPETTTITARRPGVYRFSVHDYSNRFSTTSSTLGFSGATVILSVPGQATRTFRVPTFPGTLWTVFELSGDVVTPINQMSFMSSPSGIPVTSLGNGSMGEFDGAEIHQVALIRQKPASKPKS